jgi:gliding motility-associated-like protein
MIEGMRGTLIKLLTATTLFASLFSQRATGQCALITDNYSGQVTSSVCAPVNLSMDVRYKFMLPVDPSHVQILYVWNDGTGATDLVPAISHGDTVFTATAVHTYPPADQCSYTAEAYVVYNGQQCVSSSRQEQQFSAWARDNENGAVVITDPVVAQFCEGEDIVNVVFADNSTFNCNINIEPDKPNRITRWVQFIYGTTTTGGDRIPNVTIRDPLGNVYQMTDAAGNSLPPVAGPIVEIPIPADGPNQISWPISAPAGGVAGDIFEITLRNWNICNPYDRNPFDKNPPGDTVNGDFPPITTTAYIEIITTPPQITNPSLEFCAGSPINLTLSTSGGRVNWYTDSLLTNRIHTGSNFDPTGWPTFIDNTVSGAYSYWVTETIGSCASAPSRVSFRIFDTPAPTPNAGNDTVICDNEFRLRGNTPVIGTGVWSTTSGALIDNPNDPHSMVHNLNAGPNLFRWTISNGPCVAVDEVIITGDLQPGPANAGIDQSFCNNTTTNLLANNPTNNGTGTWTVGSGNGVFNDIHSYFATVSSLDGGMNKLAWTITSRYGACRATSDTVQILRDQVPGPANAGPDRGVCDSATVNLAASQVLNGGTGTWSVITGSATLADIHNSSTRVSGLAFGTNQFRWDVVSRYGICPASTDNVVITRDQAPAPANAGMDQNLCNSITAPLGANAATIGTGTWSVITNPSAANPVFTPSVNNPNATVQISAGNEGIYQFAWTIVNASCRSTDTIRVDFGVPVPAANAGKPDTVCGTDATLNGNNPGRGTGTWSKISGPGAVSYIPGNHSFSTIAQVASGQEGYYTYEWRITSGSCPSKADTVGILYQPMPGNPTAPDQERCGPGSLLLNSIPGTGGDISRWYDNGTGGPVLMESNTYTTPSLTTSGDYWVSSYNHTTGCESYRVQTRVIINPIPGLPGVANIQHCGNANLQIPAVPGSNATTIRWYDAAVSGTLLAEEDTFATPRLTHSANYWASSYNQVTGCESPRVMVSVQIDSMPDQPGVTDASICGNGTLTLNSSIGANGTGNRWYDQATGGALLDTTVSYTTPYLTASMTYWVTTINRHTGCQSPRSPIVANIHLVPGSPNAADITQCGPDSLLLISTPGANGTVDRWYDSLTGGSMLHQGNNYQTNYLTSTKRYYVSSFNATTGCESSREEVVVTILPVPNPLVITGASTVGINQTNVIYSVTYQPGSTYNWTVPPGINLLLRNQNFVILEFPNLGIYNISVVETNGAGCPGPVANKPIEVSADVIVLDVKPTPAETCVGTNLQLSVTATGGTPSYTFRWGGDTQLLSATNVSNPVFRSLTPGTYNMAITVTDINSYSSTDSIQITVFPNPVVQITAADTVVCSGSNLQLGTNVQGGSGFYTSYTWSGQTTPLSDINIPNPVFNTFIQGTYPLAVTVTDHHGCAGRDTIRILDDSPQSLFTSDAEPGCSPVRVGFVNQSTGASTYTWDFGDGMTSTEENPTHVFTNTTTSIQYFNVKLTSVSGYQCAHTTNQFITVYPNPELSISAFPEIACAPADIMLSSIPGGYNYTWDFGDGNSSTGNFMIMHRFENNTDHDSTYYIQLVSTSFFGCQDTGRTAITLHPTPEASFTADPLTQMIPDKTVTFANTTQPGNWNYIWKFGDDSTSTARDPGVHTYPGIGNYLVRLIVKGDYCSDSTYTSVEIIPHPPIACFNPVDPGCMPLTIQFENTSSYSTSFLWEFGDGAVSNKPNPEYTYYEDGVYNIKLTAWGEDGRTTDTYGTTNEVYVLPNAYFEVAPRYVYVNDQAVHFSNGSANGDVYLWDFGDGEGSDEKDPTHVYTKEGTYDVTLNVWTSNDCYDVYVFQTAVLVEPTGKIVFPNAFRPESPIEENRVFKPGILDHVENYHLMIFNRWGELIFESHDQNVGWDGSVDGKMAKEDVYIWKVEGNYTNGQPFTDKGDVTLMH